MTGNWSLDHSPGYLTLDLMSRLVSPYHFNPFNLNPLRDIVVERVDFDRVRDCESLKLFVTSTNVRSGKQRIFSREEINLDAVMASACLPTVFQAVEIDGEANGVGGYMGNPPAVAAAARPRSGRYPDGTDHAHASLGTAHQRR